MKVGDRVKFSTSFASGKGTITKVEKVYIVKVDDGFSFRMTEEQVTKLVDNPINKEEIK